MNIKIYSSTNCTITVKAIQWLEKKHLSYQFVDLESRALSNKEVKEICSFENADIEQLFTTWSFEFKKIKAGLPKNQEDQLLFLCKTQRHLLRRPLIIIDDALFVGYDQRLMEQLILHE
ncbi:ArsC/Spx/MgsR family protein [Enterococcus mundtii]|uniref:Transcriptional regulator n=1 Tax=Enterococcus mundtii TaxID=53346 RepID=A0A2S7RNG9_ENTMU|nr:ArsC/Spx/MgsR family protein [Enterococcus mundtii]PQF20503.1 transcriptional regulator [Enterococcus mundtii]